MARPPGSQVYSAQLPGEAVVLGAGSAPLTILRQEGARRAAAQAKTTAALLQQQQADARLLVPLEAKGWRPFQDELNRMVQDGHPKLEGVYLDRSKTPFEKKMANLQYQAEIKAAADRTNEYGARYKEIVDLGNDKDYNKQALETAAYNTLFRTDPTTLARTPVPLAEYDPQVLEGVLNDPANFNEPAVIERFMKGLALKHQSDYTAAAGPGRAGLHTSFSSNIFADDGRGNPILELGPDGKQRYKIADPVGLEQAALRDPKMAALMRRNLERGQSAGAAALMGLPPGAATDEQLEALNAQTDQRTPHERQILNDMVREYGSAIVKKQELSPQAVPHSKAGAKGISLKAADAVATPTSGFARAAGDPGETATVTEANPNKGGALNFLTPTLTKQVPRPAPFEHHYPTVGVSLASQKAATVPLVVDSHDLSVLGADGTPTRLNRNQANSQVRLNATDRSFVLEVGGKRLGLPKSGTSADAYQQLVETIDNMSPEQARQAVLTPYYHGGTQARAHFLGYKGEKGKLLTEAQVAEAQRTSSPLVPVYDKQTASTAAQVTVMVPATATVDAQLARQTPGYNPRQRTAQEADLIRRLEAKGGRVVDPYHVTPAQAATPAAQRPKLRIGVPAPVAPPSPASTATTSGVRMTGGKRKL